MALRLSRPSSRASSAASSRASSRRNGPRASPARILPVAPNAARASPAPRMPESSSSGRIMPPQTNAASSVASASRPIAGNSRSTASKTASTTDQRSVQCVICMDRLSSKDAIRVPCKSRHYYGKDCLKSLVLSAIKDEPLMPPKCDQAIIPENLYLDLLNPAERKTFHAKREEYSTVNRLYCCNSRCSKFLGEASSAKKVVKCESCKHKTCGACKGPRVASHPICGGDADQTVVDELRRQGLQRCRSCRRMVDLAHGCNHIVSNTFTRIRLVQRLNADIFLARRRASAVTSSASAAAEPGRSATAQYGTNRASSSRQTPVLNRNTTCKKWQKRSERRTASVTTRCMGSTTARARASVRIVSRTFPTSCCAAVVAASSFAFAAVVTASTSARNNKPERASKAALVIFHETICKR